MLRVGRKGEHTHNCRTISKAVMKMKHHSSALPQMTALSPSHYFLSSVREKGNVDSAEQILIDFHSRLERKHIIEISCMLDSYGSGKKAKCQLELFTSANRHIADGYKVLHILK